MLREKIKPHAEKHFGEKSPESGALGEEAGQPLEKPASEGLVGDVIARQDLGLQFNLDAVSALN